MVFLALLNPCFSANTLILSGVLKPEFAKPVLCIECLEELHPLDHDVRALQGWCMRVGGISAGTAL